MDMFNALADSTRRDILEMLAIKGQLSASDIFHKFHSTPPAISQHLKVLRVAKLVDMEKRGQQRIYTINTHTIHDFEVWISKIKKRWDDRLDRLDKLLEVEKRKLRGGEKK